MDICERFLSYVAYETTANEESETAPSTKGQLALADHLAKELSDIGLEDIRVDMYGYVYAELPANTDGMATVGLIAHMDTATEMSGADINARVLLYEGGRHPPCGRRRDPRRGAFPLFRTSSYRHRRYHPAGR